MQSSRSKSLSHKHSDPKQKLCQTKSCPQTNNSYRLHRSESSFRSTVSNSVVPKLPNYNYNRQGSVAGTNSIASSGFATEIDANSGESTTSSSVLHGIILVSIMLSSLIAFICSKIRRPPCYETSQVKSYENCPMPILLYFSVITILSCLISFIIYFLHLIGQCDVSWLAKRKFAIEIVIISLIAVLLLISNSLMILQTDVLQYSVGIWSIVFSSLSIFGYGIRMAMLCNECKLFVSNNHNDVTNTDNEIDETALTAMKESLKSKLNGDANQSWNLNHNSPNLSSSNHSSVPSMRVISYVKRKKSVESTTTSVLQNPKGNAIQTNNDLDFTKIDIEDDVFIQ